MQAVGHALNSPLLEASINGARSVLLSIAGSSDLGLLKFNEAASQMQQNRSAGNIIFGTVIDESLGARGARHAGRGRLGVIFNMCRSR